MKIIKIVTAVLLSLCLVFAVTGCGAVNGFHAMLRYFSKYALTDEKDLQGEKTQGGDTCTGSYYAEYENFSGTEYLFGGTGLEWENDSELTVAYELTVDSGTAELYWRDKDGKKIIAGTSDRGTYSVTLNETWNMVFRIRKKG